MINLLKILLAISVVSALGGCAHPIKVTPDLTKIYYESNSSNHISASVGYYIPPELISLEVTTPGGGGDNVRYFPYKDMEAGYERALSNVFSGVVKLPLAPDFSRTKDQGLDYIIEPQLVTSSGSTGFFTWPPTDFTVDLTSRIRDVNGVQIATPRVIGIGQAETNARLIEHGIAGQRAMNDALFKMQLALKNLKLGIISKNKHPKKIISDVNLGVESRLNNLEELKGKNLLTQREYDEKRKQILNSL